MTYVRQFYRTTGTKVLYRVYTGGGDFQRMTRTTLEEYLGGENKELSDKGCVSGGLGNCERGLGVLKE